MLQLLRRLLRRSARAPFVVDFYADTSISPAQVRAMGATGIIRYLSYLPNSKVITRQAYLADRAAGLAVALNWEQAETNWFGGYAQGRKDGAEARRQANLIDPAYANRPIYCSIDYNVPPNQYGVALNYLHGFHDANGPTLLYATTGLIDAAVAAGVVIGGWRSNATGWYQNQNDSPNVRLRQHFISGANYDPSDILQADWGQLPTPGGPPAPPPKPTPAPVPVPIPGENMVRHDLHIVTDGAGNGWADVAVNFSHFVSATVQGSSPPNDGYWPNPRPGVQDRNGMIRVSIRGGSPNSSQVVFVVTSQ